MSIQHMPIFISMKIVHVGDSQLSWMIFSFHLKGTRHDSMPTSLFCKHRGQMVLWMVWWINLHLCERHQRWPCDQLWDPVSGHSHLHTSLELTFSLVLFSCKSFLVHMRLRHCHILVKHYCKHPSFFLFSYYDSTSDKWKCRWDSVQAIMLSAHDLSQTNLNPNPVLFVIIFMKGHGLSILEKKMK